MSQPEIDEITYAPEFQLLTCLTRPVQEVSSQATAETLLRRDFDWRLLRSLARLNRVIPLTARGLLALDGNLVPAAELAWFHAHAAEAAAQAQRASRALRHIAGALEAAGLPALLFKGPTLGAYYGDPTLRQYADLDLLFRRVDHVRALTVLAAIGYRPAETLDATEARIYMRYHSALVLRHPELIEIDAHWALTPRTWAPPVDYDGLWRRAQPFAPTGEPIWTLSLHDTLLYLALHGAKENWSKLAMVCDFAACLRVLPEHDWDRLLQTAQSQHSRRMLLLGCHLAQRLCGAAIPQGADRLIRADAWISWLGREIVAVLASLQPRNSDIFQLSRLRFRVLDRTRDRTAYVARTCLTPRLAHVRWLKLPRRLTFLYPVVKVCHDYVLLPAWSLLKAARARVVRDGG